MSSSLGRGMGAGSGAGSTSSLANAALQGVASRFLVKLKGGPKKNEDIQRRAAHALREFVDAQRREMPSRDFSAFFISLSHCIFDLVNSSDNCEKQVGGNRVEAPVCSVLGTGAVPMLVGMGVSM